MKVGEELELELEEEGSRSKYVAGELRPEWI